MKPSLAASLAAARLPVRIPALLAGLMLAAAPASLAADPPADPVAHAIGIIPFDYFEGDLDFMDSIPHPEDFLGHAIGERFTRHHHQTRYLEALAAASDRVQIERYGFTHQRRPLHLVTISSPSNLDRLDEILADNLRLADPATSSAQARRIIDRNPVIVWLSFGVHGNETSPAEAAMMVAYTLAAGHGEPLAQWLENTVVVIDPLLNPDGHERYLAWFQNTRGVTPDARRDAAEHDEPWPGGRTNHYLFDLNRDWVWGVHPESRSRVEAYRRVLPHLHIDNHEQGYRSPYFFGLGDDPYNTNIPQETKDWVAKYGDHNAEVFDRYGLVYATKERFDYLYPGYGKVTPVYHGAVGMLTEQAGHGFAGLAVEVGGDYVLTLRERARNHYLTNMSYIETSATNRAAQLERFRRYFTGSVERGREDPMSFYFSKDNDPHLLAKLADLCALHGIEIEALAGDTPVAGLRSYRDGGEADIETLPAGTLVIRTDQRMGRFARALMEPVTEVTDRDTYDITAWSVPVCFGLHAWYAAAPVDAELEQADIAVPAGSITGDDPVAVMVDAGQHPFPAAVGIASRLELFARMAGEPITNAGEDFASGSLILHVIRNDEDKLDAFVDEVQALGMTVHFAPTGMTEAGPVLGTNANAIMDLPRVALVRGEPTSSYSFGQHWHLLDIASPIPHTLINADAITRASLDDFNVIVLPEGARFSGSSLDRLKEWIRAGGTVVASGSAASWADSALLELKSPEDPDDLPERPDNNELTYAEREERGVEDRVPGALLRVEIDTTHPLASGCPEWTGVVKSGTRRLGLGESGYAVARYAPENPAIGGVISDRNEQRLAGSPFMTVHRMGRGKVISIADDVTMRGFMHGPMRLLLNAITLGPSM